MPTKRGSSWQGIVYHTSLAGGRVRRNFETEKAAKAWELDSKARLIRGEPVDLGDNVKHASQRKQGLPHTLNELVSHVEASRWAAKESGSRQADNARDIIRLIGANRPVSSINKADIDVARGKLLKMGNQPATVNRKVAALSTCLTEAVDMGLIVGKPKCAKFAESEHRIRRFTPEEEATALDYFERMGELWMADFIALSVDTGLRQGEMLNLRHRDVQADKLMVWGTGAKSGKTRSVPLTGRARDILEKRANLDYRKDNEGFTTALYVFDVTRFAVSWQWDKLSALLGLVDDAQFVRAMQDFR